MAHYKLAVSRRKGGEVYGAHIPGGGLIEEDISGIAGR